MEANQYIPLDRYQVDSFFGFDALLVYPRWNPILSTMGHHWDGCGGVGDRCCCAFELVGCLLACHLIY